MCCDEADAGLRPDLLLLDTHIRPVDLRVIMTWGAATAARVAREHLQLVFFFLHLSHVRLASSTAGRSLSLLLLSRASAAPFQARAAGCC